MSQRLILDWDDHEVRLLAVDGQGGNLRVRAARTAPLPDGPATVADVRSALEPLVAPHRSARTETMVLVGGRNLQFRLLRLPPVPADELPDMVRLREAAEFPATDESAAVDFYPFEHTPPSPQPVFVGRLSASTLALARDVVAKLHLTLTHVVPRGCGVAQWVALQRPELQAGVHLVVALRASEMDLIGIDQGAAAVVRSVPLPEDSDQQELVRYAAIDLRRTLAAVSSKLAVDQVESLVWVVGSSRDQELASRVGEQLQRTITTIDLRQQVADATENDVPWPDEAARFAGLLGAGQAVSQGTATINFLAPRKRVEKKPPKRTYALAGVAAALLLSFSGWLLYSRVARIERETEGLIAERDRISSEVDELAVDQGMSEQVAAWLASEVNWLEEMDRLAMSLRPKELDEQDYDAENDVMLTSLTLSKPVGARGVGGSMTLAGGVRDGAVLEAVEQRLRDERHEVNPQKIFRTAQQQPYVWSFETEIKVVPSKEDAK